MHIESKKTIRSHKDLDVWKRSINLVKDIYQVSKAFPAEEKFGIISQVRRAAVSVPSNIAEGFGRNKLHPKELIHFLNYSQGSLSEIETLLELCKLLGFINDSTFNSLNIQLINIRTMLVKLISSIEK
ncbi:MAG: four helix bundle protein [Bacteroidales bacterium]